MNFLRLHDPLLSILFENEDIIAIDKPYGFNAHTNDSKIEHSDFIQDGLIEIFEKNLNCKLHIIHRLDQTTTGVMIFGKSTESAKKYAEYFFDRKVQKTYLFITKSISQKNTFEINQMIIHKGKELDALTDLRLMDKNSGFELWQALPHTGRNHQIRIHAQFAEIPILGDEKYTGADYPFLCLHNCKIEFPNGVIIESKPPEYFKNLNILNNKQRAKIIFEIDRRQRLFSLADQQQCLRLVHHKNKFKNQDFTMDQFGEKQITQPSEPTENQAWIAIDNKIKFELKADAKNNTSYDQQFNEAVASYYAPSSFLYQTDVKGVRWNIAKNDYLPSIEVGVERNSSKGKMLMKELELTNTNISGSINNSSANDVSRYSLQYIYNDSKNASFQQNFTNHELQFYGNSKLSDKLDAFSSAVYTNRQNSITRTIELGGSFVVDEKTRHNVRLTSTENSLKSNGVYQSLSTSFQHQMYLSLTDQLNMTVGSMASKDHVIINQQSLSSDRGQVQVQLNYTKQLPLFAFNGTYSALLSEEKQLYGNRKFIYSTQAALNATSIRWKTMQFALRENVDFTRSYVFGNMVNNTVGAEISSTEVPNTLVQVGGERTDTRSSEYAAVSNRVLHTLTGQMQTILSLNTSVDIQSSKRWTYSWYLEKTTTSNVSLNQNGLMRNLMLQARGEYTYNSFTNITMLRGEATAIYQFYAFALQAKYLLFSYSGIQTSGFALEVSRPIQHNFSQQ